MSMQNQTKVGLAASVTAGSMMTAKKGTGEKMVGVVVNDAWRGKNAFQLGSDLIQTAIGFAVWAAIGAGLLYVSEATDIGWVAWVGLIMLGLSFMFPVVLATLFLRAATAGVMLRVFRPLSREWMNAASAYRKPSGASVVYVLVYTVCLPFLLVNDAFRVLRFAVSKLLGRNVRFASTQDRFNLKLIAELNKAVRTVGADRADFLHYKTWCNVNMPVLADRTPTYDDWKNGLRSQVVRELTAKYGPIIKA
jgi:hypothetical protein